MNKMYGKYRQLTLQACYIEEICSTRYLLYAKVMNSKEFATVCITYVLQGTRSMCMECVVQGAYV